MFRGLPLLYRPMAGGDPTPGRMGAAAVLASLVGLQFGALGVVFETALSAIFELPFASFLALMPPIHPPIAVVEGLVTAAVVSWFASTHPDGREWSSPG